MNRFSYYYQVGVIKQKHNSMPKSAFSYHPKVTQLSNVYEEPLHVDVEETLVQI